MENVKNKTYEDTAILKQENTLLKTQNDEINKKNQEQKNYYENIISNLQTKFISLIFGVRAKFIEAPSLIIEFESELISCAVI